jgi:hypothetical protein
LGRTVSPDSGELTSWLDALRAGTTLAEVRNAIAHSPEAAGAIQAAYRTYIGRAIDPAWLALYQPYLRDHGLEVLKDQMVHDFGADTIREAYSSVLGGTVPTGALEAYKTYLRAHGVEGLRAQLDQVSVFNRATIDEVFSEAEQLYLETIG